jgi:hypothetical protein
MMTKTRIKTTKVMVGKAIIKAVRDVVKSSSKKVKSKVLGSLNNDNNKRSKRKQLNQC